MPVNSMGDVVHAEGWSIRAHTKVCRRFGCQREGEQCDADDVDAWQEGRRFSYRVVSLWSPNGGWRRWFFCSVTVSSQCGVQDVVRRFVRFPVVTLGGETCPLVGGGHVERFDCNLAQDDPGEREGDAGRGVVEMRERKVTPSVEAH